jgi:hypothetical protein
MNSEPTPGQSINSLVVIALFSSQFELENALRGVKLSMDLSVAKGRLRDGQGTGGAARCGIGVPAADLSHVFDPFQRGYH